ncbi:MAG: alpha-E domain-containing protein [Candidatus Contendobacter sp.]|nr:alpha-E domain-containing protein [Candidatus Contendobacter sp.]
MTRYVERAEDTARLINVNTNLLLDLPRTTTFGWLPLIFIVGAESQFFEKDPHRLVDEANVVRFLINDRDHPGSIISSLAAARENLRTTRDTVPREAWEQINGLYIYARDHVPSRRGRYEFLRRVILGAQQIGGLLAGAMSRTAAYDFVRLGHYLERADMTTRILDVRSANLLSHARQTQQSQGQSQMQTQTPASTQEEQDPFESIQWMSVLKSLSAYQMYRQQVRVRVSGPDVLKFLLQDEYFPRAVAFCLRQLDICLRKLPRHDAALAALAALRQKLNAATVPELSREGLHDFIDEVQIGLSQLHDQIAAAYFAH